MTDRIEFLENVLEDLKSDKITEAYKLKAIDEFTFKFDNPPDLLTTEKLYSDKDFLTFLLSCWYFYQIILKTADN